MTNKIYKQIMYILSYSYEMFNKCLNDNYSDIITAVESMCVCIFVSTGL